MPPQALSATTASRNLAHCTILCRTATLAEALGLSSPCQRASRAQRRAASRSTRAHGDTTFDVLHTPRKNGAKRHLHRTLWSPQRPPDTIWSWASASSATRSGEPSTMEATAREHLPLAAVLLVTASFNHTAVVFCTAPSSCIMLCSMHGCARDTLWHYPCSLGPRPYAGGGREESMVWPSDIACTSSAR